MKILYISSAPSQQEFNRMKKNVRPGANVVIYGMNEASFKFHMLIMDGLKHKHEIYSLIGRSTSHKTHYGVFWKARKEAHDHIRYKHLGYLNLPILKQFILSVSFFIHTLNWLIRNAGDKEKAIIIDASYITVVPFVILAKKIIPCHTMAIFCDIYEYMADVKDARDQTSRMNRLIGKVIKRVYGYLDSMIMLTEAMNHVVNPKAKPYRVIEGLVDINMKDIENRTEDKAPYDVVMYAGALREQYGLKNLVDGFMNYHNQNARLWIMGGGDYAASIREAAQKDKRIEFYGQQELPEVIKMELKAKLLINPRPADSEFVKYSFPSKNMEYMVSGTPLLTTCLPGMPKEYYQYVYAIEGNSADDITRALESVFSIPDDELKQKGLLAKQFVIHEKNNVAQAERIIMLLKEDKKNDKRAV